MTQATRTQSIERWMRLYGYIILLAGIYGIVVAHLPVILGHPWSVCIINDGTSIPCVLTIHLYDAVLTLLLLLFGWYSVSRASASRLSSYLGFLSASLMIEVAFFTFETVELIWNFHNAAAAWENYIIASLALILLGGFVLGVYVHQKISVFAAQKSNTTPIDAPLPQGEDGFYHPSSEEQIIELVEFARAKKLQIRCRGAAHSVARAIYTDPGVGEPEVPNKVAVENPPDGPNLNLMLDQLTGLEWVDEAAGIVEAEAGIHLGPAAR